MPATISHHASGDGRSLLQRIETTTVSQTHPDQDNAVSFESAVRHLRAQGIDDQLTILESLQSAINEAEEFTNRTLRQSVTHTIYYRGWRSYIPIPFPPLQSITSVKYYDVSDVLQTMSTNDYAVHAPTKGVGRVVFETDYSYPNLNTDRPDPVQIICVTGWGSEGEIPGAVKQGIRLLCEAAHDGIDAKRDEARKVLQPWVFRG